MSIKHYEVPNVDELSVCQLSVNIVLFYRYSDLEDSILNREDENDCTILSLGNSEDIPTVSYNTDDLVTSTPSATRVLRDGGHTPATMADITNKPSESETTVGSRSRKRTRNPDSWKQNVS